MPRVFLVDAFQRGRPGQFAHALLVDGKTFGARLWIVTACAEGHAVGGARRDQRNPQIVRVAFDHLFSGRFLIQQIEQCQPGQTAHEDFDGADFVRRVGVDSAPASDGRIQAAAAR